MKKFLLSSLTILMSTLVWAVAGEEVAGSVNAPAPRLSDVASESSRVSLFSSGGTSTYRYTATGDLSTSTSGADITLYFDVSDYFAEIKSARIELMAYDVDYPGATEADITYLNGVDLGQWLKGENGDWEKNTIQITNLSILKTPAVNGGSVRNTFYVDVNAHNGGWVTCISEAILIIEGTKFSVTASDGTEAEGVYVQWTSLPNATYTLWRGEKPGEKTKQLGEGVFTTTEFLDTEVSSGKVYYYTVEASFSSGVDLFSTQSGTISGTNDGYADSDRAPKLLYLRLPSFWLDNNAPLVWAWNNFNKEEYKVTKFEYEITGIRKGSLKNDNDEIEPFDLMKENLADGEGFNFKENDFGKRSVILSWTYQNSKGEKKTLSETREITIYFNKYDNNNWYYYWPKMGAIVEGYIGDKPKFKLGGGEHGAVDPNVTANLSQTIKCDGYPRILPKAAITKITYNCSVSNLAPTTKPLVLEGGTVESKTVIGIEALAATLAHELKHEELYQKYYGAAVLIGDLKVNSGFTELEAIRTDLNTKFENGKPKPEYSSVTNLSQYKGKIDELAKNSWKGVVCDLDGDIVLDHTEGGSSLTVGNPDTYNLQEKIDEEYATYGDNEYLARKAEEDRGKYFDKEKDWAFPGSKCCPEGSGMTKEEWDKSGEKKDKLNSLNPEIFAKDILASTTKSADLTQLVVFSSASVRLMSSSEEAKEEMGGALDVLPSLFEIEESELSLGGDLGDQTLDYATAEGYTVLATSFTIVNEGDALEAAEVTGYLVDTEGNPVAFAQTTCNLPIGNTTVTLEFPGTSLRRIKSDSYRLALLQVIKTSGDLSEIVFSKTQFENDIFSYNNTQFKGAKANFLYNTFSETKSQAALTVEVNGYVVVPGVYQIEARLEDLDGNLISHIADDVEFASGEVTATFKFPSEEIYLSRADGPYEICFVRMSQEGMTIDERRVPYTTKAYSYTDFTPEHVCLVVDEASFTREADSVGDDGLISNLSFSFDVDYQGEEDDTPCQGRLCLYGANDTLVGFSEEQFALKKGVNTLTFLFDGTQVQQSGVDGPYYVKDVLLRPQNGAAECFEPKMTPIELNADDFGAYPFVVTDKVVARENNGNYDLILPIEIDRAHTLTLYAMLVDAKEQCVATATTSKTYSAPCEDELILTFTAADIATSGRSGPYKVRLIQATTDIPNIEMVSIPVPVCTPTYEVVNDEVTITGCTSPFGALEIPDVIEGYPVTTIAVEAFKDCSNLTSVTIPSSVTSIGDSAFSECSGLTSVTIPSSVTTIGDSAFEGCFSLTSVTIPSSVTTIGVGAFSRCSNLWKDENGVQYESVAKVVLINVPTSMTGEFVIPSTVRFIHSDAFYECSRLTSVTIPESVTSIGAFAFSGCWRLTSVTIPSSVTWIGNYAFYGCSRLTSVTIPESVTSIGNNAFAFCYDLTSVTIPEGVTSIGDYAFYCCESLTSVTIPEGVTSIGNGAFSGCSGLTSFVVDSANQHYSVINDLLCTKDGKTLVAYLGGLTSVTIPEGVTTIEAFAFYNCSGLTSVTIPSSVTSIGDYAFAYCSRLTFVTIPSSVTTIGVGAFSRCSNLWKDENGVQYESVAKVVLIAVPTSMTGEFVIPNTVRFIHSDAFRSCSSLTSVTIPSSVTSIGDYAFYECSSLTSVTIPSSVTSIGESAFYRCSNLISVHISNLAAWCGIDFEDTYGNPLYYATKLYLNGELITDLVIPEGVTSIGDYAFYGCSSLTSVTIPSSVTSIGYSAFCYCRSLTSVTIPSSVTSIGDYAFYNCSSLTSVTIPSSVTTIGDYAFYYCSSLKTVTFEGEPPMVGSSAFSNVASGCKGYYPSIKSTAWEAVISNGKWNRLTMKEGNTILEFLTYEIIDGKVTIAGCDTSAFGTLAIPATIDGYPVTIIGDYAFEGCSSLTSVTIPSSVTSIGNYAFQGCSSLTSVTIPEGVPSIGHQAFYNCSSLTSVTIPEGVTSIGDEAFYGCSGLTSVDFKGEPPSVGSNVFYNISSSATGSYLPQYASEWEAVIDANGKWNGLTMVQKAVATLPEGLPEATGEWLTDVLEASGITSGCAVLAEGTTVEALEAARLLGITPSVSVSGNIATVAAESSFEVSEVAVADNAVSLAVTITVEAGKLPENPSLGGVVKLLVCDTLDGDWREVTPDPSQIKLTRISDTEARLSVTQSVDAYNFFKVLVK